MSDRLLTNQSNIPREIRDLLRKIGSRTRLPVYLVGGFVRDLLLGCENLDLDMVVEGDAIGFARQLGESWGWEIQTHQRFGTATLIRPTGARIDFARARSETYERPGALPLVKPCSIEDDLRRRDFSINALAIRLNSDDFGRLIDCFDGIKDLQAGRIRALHAESFLDDPTRIFRAVRYEGRYDFRIEAKDRARIREALRRGALPGISGERIRNEINHILAEKAAPRMVQRLIEFDVFPAIYPLWKVVPGFSVDWTAVQKAIDWAGTNLADEEIDRTQIAWMSLFGATGWSDQQSCHEGTPTYVIQAIADRLVLPHRLRRLFQAETDLQKDLADGRISTKMRDSLEKKGIPLSRNLTIRGGKNRWLISDTCNKKTFTIRKEGRALYSYEIQTELTASQNLFKTLDRLSADSKPSEIYRLLKSYPVEALVVALMQPERPEWRAEKIEDYLMNLRKVKPLISGNDLIRRGAQPGKAFTDLLSKAFAAQLDGEISTKEEAYQFLGFDDVQSV